MKDKSIDIQTYQRDKLRLHILKTGVLALEQMQEMAAHNKDVDRWLFLQDRIEDFEFKIDFIKKMRSAQNRTFSRTINIDVFTI
ncbi:MAG: hypothetical protein WC139_12835 [Candidatus Kapaibacterium sp.]